jgi:pilus assembly protein FimV
MLLDRGGRLTKVRVRIAITVIRFLFAACLVMPLLGHAAGLGRLTLQSALGEPLRAEVEITSLQPGETDSLTARLGSPEAFRAAGIEYSPTLVSIRVALDRRDGRPFLRLTSTRPVDDPFLDVIIELQWSTGRLVREYTFLLDPPQYREKPAAAAPAPSTAEVARPSPTPAPAAPEARPLPVRPSGGTANTYEVRRGDTLGKIARENRPEGVTMQQMLVALYRANQSAFIRNNMNLVRAGRILQIPDREAAAGVASTEANRVVHTHMSDFADYRAKLGAAVAAKPAAATPGREATGRIAAKPEAPAPGAQKDQLKLSKAETAKPSAPAARAAREDDKVASDRALKEAQSRVTDLEKNVGDLQKLVELKNKQLAQLEQQAKPAAAASAKDAPKVAEAAKPAPAAPEAPKPAAEAPKPEAEAPKPAPEAPKPAAEAPKPAAEAPKPAAPVAAKPEAAKAAAPAKPTPKPPVEASLVDEFLGNPMALYGLLAVILLLVAYGAYAWRKKKANQSRFQDSVLGATAPTAVAAPAPTPSPHAVETAAAVSAAVAATQASPAPESDDVDPIAEADVYLAYGRDTQAEEILNEALSMHPDRVPVHAKLLEIFAHRHDTKAFEKTAKKIHDLTQGSGPEWEKARALGRTVDPENPFYGGGAGAVAAGAAAAAAAPAPGVDFDLGGGGPAGDAQAPAAPALDFDIGAATTPGGETQPFTPGDTLILQPGEVPPAAGVPAKSETLDFDIGSLAPAAPAPPEPVPAPQQTGGLDFDLDLDLGAQKPAAPAPGPAVDITTISLDLGKPDSAAAAHSADPRWQEVATKLDLAKAYQGMGDKDGARELLNEVISQGDTAQQNEAKQMLAALG